MIFSHQTNINSCSLYRQLWKCSNSQANVPYEQTPHIQIPGPCWHRPKNSPFIPSVTVVSPTSSSPFLIPILQRKKVKSSDVKWFAQVHTGVIGGVRIQTLAADSRIGILG